MYSKQEAPNTLARNLKGDKDVSLPEPYETKLNWANAKELQRLPCGFAGKDHTCVIIDAPVKSWIRPSTPGHLTKMTDGSSRIMIDTETGIWLRCHTVELVEGSRGGYQWDITYTIKDMGSRAAPDETLQVTDIHGNPISLANLKGQTVLLDFWTTWCPPCQADASSIEKLNQKYGSKSLTIVGISVSEDRETVEKYLKKHPHSFAVVLSSENQLPRPYQIGVFPTYLIIGPDGTLTTAEQGDQGFGKLRKDLEKAGLQAD